jgi:hypothetical protein
LPKNRRISSPLLKAIDLLLMALALLGWQLEASGQSGAPSPDDAPRSWFGILAAWSPDSSHILMGEAENRILINLGGSYSRRLLINHVMSWQYDAELMPIVLESDPISTGVTDQTLPTPGTYVFANGPVVQCLSQATSYDVTVNGVTYTGTETIRCTGRRWTIGEAMSPVGFRWNFRPRRPIEPFLDGHGGLMYTTQPIPVTAAGSFNFTFDFGAGVELYRSARRSIRAELRFHHISNHDTATANPGIDNVLYQVTYAFGR